MRILHIDDSQDLLRVTAELLQELGHVTHRALGYHHAGDYLRNFTYDAVFSNFGDLRESAFLENIDLIRKMHSGPVILLTGVPRQTPGLAKADGILVKPFGPLELAGMVQRIEEGWF